MHTLNTQTYTWYLKINIVGYIQNIKTFIGNPLWSSSLGHSSSKQEASGLTPTGGDFLFCHISVSKELFINFH